MKRQRHNDTAILYCRVSTEGQALEGISLAAQEAELRSYCDRRGLVVDAVVIDAGVSGSVPLDRRPAGAIMATAIRRRNNPIGHIVATKLDRLFRNLGDCLDMTERWDKAGAALHLVDMGGQTVDTSTAMGRFFMATMGAVAELERGMISERTKAALAHKRATGRRTSLHAPVGFSIGQDGDTLEKDEAEQTAVDRARQLHADGASVRAVAATLDAEGFTPRGKRWHPTTVARLIRRLELEAA